MSTINLKDCTVDFLVEYSEYDNYMKGSLSILDGLKPIQRRLLYSSYKICKTNMVKTAQLIGHTMSNYHPHGDIPIWTSIIFLVQNNLLSGKGNWGSKISIGEDIKPAAPRYTSVKLNPDLFNVFNLIEYTVYIKNDLDKIEPLFIPTPFPILLTEWSEWTSPAMGIGNGISFKTPVFTKKSIIEFLKSFDLNKLEFGAYKNTTPILENTQELLFKNKFNIKYNINILYNKKKRILSINSYPKNLKSLSQLEEFITNKLKEFNYKNVPRNISIIERYDKKSGGYFIDIYLERIKDKDIINKLMKELEEFISYKITYQIYIHYPVLIDKKTNKKYDLYNLFNNSILQPSKKDKLKLRFNNKNIQKVINQYIEIKNLNPDDVLVKYIVAETNLYNFITYTLNIYLVVLYYALLKEKEKLEYKIKELNCLLDMQKFITGEYKDISKLKNKYEYEKFLNIFSKKFKYEPEFADYVFKKYTIHKLLTIKESDIEVYISDLDKLNSNIDKFNIYSKKIAQNTY